MVKFRYILLFGLIFALFGCKKAHDVSVYYYMATELEETSISPDSIGIITKAYDRFLLPYGQAVEWINPDYSFCRRVIIPKTTEAAVIDDVTAAAKSAHASLGENFEVKGWKICKMSVMLQEDGYLPNILFSHDYSGKNNP